jgi:GNAT superfamily N-acetyltransferase
VIEITRARTQEWRLVREIRLAALRDAPDWFWGTYEREVAEPPSWWRQFIGAGAWFVAWEEGRPVGIAAAIFEEKLGRRVWQLVSMWVHPEARRAGVGAQLVDRVKDWAQAAGVQTLQLDVTQGNDAARRLYERCGFRLTGRTTPHPRDPLSRELEMHVTFVARRDAGDAS